MDDIQDWVKNHKTMVCLEATEDQLRNVCEYAKWNSKRFAAFIEPDLNDMLAAVAFEPLTKREGNAYFRSFKLA
jgi:hypothetical protein